MTRIDEIININPYNISQAIINGKTSQTTRLIGRRIMKIAQQVSPMIKTTDLKIIPTTLMIAFAIKAKK